MLLESGRAIAPIADNVRVRVLARARSVMATVSAEQADARPATHHRGLAIGIAASVAFAVGAAAAAVALRGAQQQKPPAALPPTPEAPLASCAPTIAAQPPVLQAPSASAEPKLQRVEPVARESYTAELALLQRAQAAYADRNFATTLLLVSEHARRFPHGRLAEEREALRVKALNGAGRDEDARQAASAFAARYPRSALLPRQ